jgi:hypothetical protein
MLNDRILDLHISNMQGSATHKRYGCISNDYVVSVLTSEQRWFLFSSKALVSFAEKFEVWNHTVLRCGSTQLSV